MVAYVSLFAEKGFGRSHESLHQHVSTKWRPKWNELDCNFDQMKSFWKFKILTKNLFKYISVTNSSREEGGGGGEEGSRRYIARSFFVCNTAELYARCAGRHELHLVHSFINDNQLLRITLLRGHFLSTLALSAVCDVISVTHWRYIVLAEH